MSIVLVLDADWQPLRIAPWTRAITDLFLGRVEVIEYSRDRAIRCVNHDVPMPAVVRVLRRIRRRKEPIRFSRLHVFTRDDFSCAYCGVRVDAEDLTFDHVLPRSAGGRTTWENVVACCVPCNSRKANRTPEQAGMRLRRKPVRPEHLPVVTVRRNIRQVPPEWRPYWNATLDEG